MQALVQQKNLINAYETVLAGNNYYLDLKNTFNTIAEKYERGFYKEVYSKIIELKNYIPIIRNKGDENFNKFVGEFENNILAIDFLLRQLCTN